MEEIKCIYCDVDVCDISILCIECYVYLCPQCFSHGAEIGTHIKTHMYSVATKPKKENWRYDVLRSLSEEIDLLKCMMKGYGLWDKVSDYLETKTPEEVEKYYRAYYMYGDIGEVTLSNLYPLQIKDHTDEIYDNKEEHSIDSSKDGHQLPESLCFEIEYMPVMKFYKQPFDKDAEYIFENCGKLKEDAEFSPYKPTNLEIAYIHIYRGKVFKRHKIEQLIYNYNLIKLFADSLASKSSRTSVEKAEISLRNELKAFCRFISPSEHEALIQGLKAEKKLRTEFEKLKEKYLKMDSGKSSTKSSKSERSKQSKSKENKHVKNSAAASKESGVSIKEMKSPNNIVASSKRKRPFQEENIDVSHSDSCLHLLSQSEKRLCSTLDLEASSYLALKIVLFRDQNLLNKEQKNTAGTASSTNREKILKVSEFMSTHKWIRNG